MRSTVKERGRVPRYFMALEPKVIFTDRHLLLVDKPAGLLSQPTKEQPHSAESWGKEWIRRTEGRDNPFLTPLFRLDRPVSGLLLFARSSKCASRMQGQRRAYFMRKCYLALVEGTLKEGDEGIFEDWISHGHHRAEASTPERGDHALLAYRCLASDQRRSLIEIDLLTGRYHQIRYQCASRHYPICGDGKYGSRASHPDTIALHHAELTFIHPVSGELLLFSAPWP